MPRIIHRYIFKEICVIFAISLVTFTFILLVAKVFTFTDLIVNKGIPPAVLGWLIVYKLPYFFVFTFPMSTLMSVLVTFLRLSQDHEITALKASGVSLVQLLPPVLVVSLLACAATTTMAVALMPQGNRAFNGLIHRLTHQKAYVGIRPRIFIDDFKDMVLYVNSVDPSGRHLERIFIADERDPKLSHAITARQGTVLKNSNTGDMVLHLVNGEIHYDSKDLKRSDTVRFDTYDLSLVMPGLGTKEADRDVGEKEMHLKELWRMIRTAKVKDARYNMLVMAFVEKFSIPASCLILAFVGVSVAVRSKAQGYSASVAMALAIFLAYYVLLSAAKSLGESGTVPPAVGMWVPDLLLGVLAAVMFARACREAPATVAVTVFEAIDRAKGLLGIGKGPKRP
ncbi:MAG: LPS export ABC transporter permease LptF [Deltaproteobacteria bacterium]|nr:LPS export ABC transporter permease LptF [Deltaproteobacteria bacterium]